MGSINDERYAKTGVRTIVVGQAVPDRSGALAPGPTSAGKTTLGARIVAELRQRGIPAVLFDGDEVRGFFGQDFGFGSEHRLRVVEVLAHLANKASEAGLNVVVAALTSGGA
jgi:adenylylsulfate kinase-like enzyme